MSFNTIRFEDLAAECKRHRKNDKDLSDEENMDALKTILKQEYQREEVKVDD